ncbi:Glycosyl transferase, group 1 [hydrothermal vent metagenome]|uniref:Glycosyl transferase, group 1 n=1 Tax=hydrothermal vent metagenome TaxID=652676 RepID=A0A1W1CNV4_9ZZZZ
MLSVDLVVVNKTGAYSNKVDTEVNLIDFNKNRVLLAIFPLISYFKNNKPNATLTTMPHLSLIVSIARFLSGIKTNLVVRQPNFLSLNSGDKWWTKYYIKLVCWFFNRSDNVIGISQGVCENLSKLGVKKCQTIYNPAVFSEILKLAEKKVDFEFKKKTFIAVGRLVKQKNFSLLIDAFAQVKKQLDCQLIILGEGELETKLEKQIKKLNLEDDIHLLGFVDNPFYFMKNADVFVLSSLWEGFGNVVAESLALGTQVVSTNCPSGPSEILEDGKYGFLVEVNNSEKLASAMLNALENPIDEKLLIKRSLDFRIEEIAKQYKKVLLNES